jgi:hypothetical protein
VAVIGGATSYIWSYSGTGATISGTGNSVTISFSTNATSGNLTVRGTNSCGLGTVSPDFAITVNVRPSATITAASSVCTSSTGNTASVPPGAATYAWTIGNGTIVGSTTSSNITYTAGASGSVTLGVTVTANGCSASNGVSVAISTSGTSQELNVWKNFTPDLMPLTWQAGSLNNNGHSYPSGGSVPFRVGLPAQCPGSTWSFIINYDFSKNGITNEHFIDFLTTYNASELTVNGNECAVTSAPPACSVSPTTFPIPTDPGASNQIPGNFTIYNGTIT